MQAAINVSQMKKLFILEKKKVSTIFIKNIYINSDCFESAYISPKMHIVHYFTFSNTSQKRIYELHDKNKIQTRVFLTLHMQPCYNTEVKFMRNKYRVSEDAAKDISLPSSYSLTKRSDVCHK